MENKIMGIGVHSANNGANNPRFPFPEFPPNQFKKTPENRPQGRREAITVLDLGFSRDLWNKKGSLALSVRDLFNSRKYRFETETSNYISESEFQWRRGPQFVLTLNYRLNQSDRDQRKEGGRSENGYEGGGDDFKP